MFAELPERLSVDGKILYLDVCVLGENLIQQFYPDVAVGFLAVI